MLAAVACSGATLTHRTNPVAKKYVALGNRACSRLLGGFFGPEWALTLGKRRL